MVFANAAVPALGAEYSNGPVSKTCSACSNIASHSSCVYLVAMAHSVLQFAYSSSDVDDVKSRGVIMAAAAIFTAHVMASAPCGLHMLMKVFSSPRVH